MFLIMSICGSPQSTSETSGSLADRYFTSPHWIRANHPSTWITSIVTSLCTHCVVTLSVLVVCVFQRLLAKRAGPLVVLPSCYSLEGVPAAKSTPCFSFNLALLMTCTTIPVDNNLSTDLPLPLSLLTSTPVYSLCARQPPACRQTSNKSLPSSRQFPFTNLNTLSTTNTLTTTYSHHFTSFSSYLLVPPTSTTLDTMAPRKNTKSASTPAPVAASKVATAYTGRKTRGMMAAEEKAAAEAGNTAANVNAAATESGKTVKPAATQTVETVKTAAVKTVKTVKPAATKAETVETAKTAQPVKTNTLKSASNALKALKGAVKTNQVDTDDTTVQVTTGIKKPVVNQPITTMPAAAKPTVTMPPVKNMVTEAKNTMSMAQAAELMRMFRCSKPSAQTPAVQVIISPERKVFPPQPFVDAELNKWLLVQKNKPSPWGTQLEPVRPENMVDDFKNMGFSSAKVKELVVMKEPVKVDGLAQLAPSAPSGSFVPGTGPEPPPKRVRKSPKYKDLVIFEDKGTQLSLPPQAFTRLHLLTYITRLGSIRRTQPIPCRARRAALRHHQVGHVRSWQRPRPRDEHEDEIHQIAGHTREPPQQSR
jgi:hypothetical protein